MSRIRPESVLHEACDLVEAGAYETALAKLLWFHENALLHDPFLCGVRLSFALGRWADLAKIYAPARTALEGVRTCRANDLCLGLFDKAVFAEVASIDEALGQLERTSVLFEALAVSNQEFAQKCLRAALPALIQTRKFELARRFMSSPSKTVERRASQLNTNLRHGESLPFESIALLRQADIRVYVDEVSEILLILARVGERDHADALRIAAIESIEDGPSREQVRTLLKTNAQKMLSADGW